MKKISRIFLSTTCLLGSLSHADFVPAKMPHGALPAVSEQAKKVLQNSVQTSPTPSPASHAALARTALPQNLPAALYKSGNTSANNFDNQHAYHNKIKQLLKSQKK